MSNRRRLPGRPRSSAVLSWTPEPMSVDEFEAMVWCPDCNPEVVSVVLAGVGVVDIKHDRTCPSYRAATADHRNLPRRSAPGVGDSHG